MGCKMTAGRTSGVSRASGSRKRLPRAVLPTSAVTTRLHPRLLKMRPQVPEPRAVASQRVCSSVVVQVIWEKREYLSFRTDNLVLA